MPPFEYEALTASGRLMRGTFEAAGPDEARQALADMQLAVQRLERSRPPGPRTPVGRSELRLFNEQLAAIARAGIPLERSLRELAADAASARMRRLIERIADELESGTELREAFEKHAGSLPPLYGRIIEAGVKSGRLGEMLTSLNRHTEVAARTRQIVFEAVCYPVVVLLLAAGLFTGFLVYVVPPFGRIFESSGWRVPPATATLLALSGNVGGLWIGFGCLAALAVGARFAMGLAPAGRRFRERVKLSVPVLGRLLRHGLLGRFADLAALLTGAGLDLPSCLRLAGSATGSDLLAADCEAVARGVEAGGRLTDSAANARVLPRLFVYSVEFGASRNELTDSLYGLAGMYDDRVRIEQGRLQAVLLPVLVVTVGLGIGWGIVSLFLPMAEMLRMMQGYVM